MLFIEIARFVVRGLKARFRDQKSEFDIIRRHLRPGDIVCDIGANKGSFVLFLSRWCRGGRVVAFEPQPAFAEHLAAVCRAMKLGNVTVEASAVYSHSGAQDLFVPSGHSPGASLTHKAVEAESFTTLSVPVVALDDYFADSDRVALLKIDVEGAELGVFKGAERILRRHAPLLVFECENRHLAPGHVGDVFALAREPRLPRQLHLPRPTAAAVEVRGRRAPAPARRMVLEEPGLLQQFCLCQRACCDGVNIASSPASVTGKGTPGR